MTGPKRSGTTVLCLALVLAVSGCGRQAALNKGRQFLEIGDLGRAIEQFSRAVQDQPRQTAGHYWLARAYCLADSAELACREYAVLSRLDYQAAQDSFLRQKVAVFSGLEPYALTRLTFSPGNDALPAVSADGRKIAFSSKRDGNPEIYIMAADGRDQTRLTDDPAIEFMPSFSPDGKYLAYVSDRHGNNEIYLYDLQTRKERRLTKNKCDDLLPRFSPDGEEIFFLSDSDGNYEIWTLPMENGRIPKKISPDSLEKGDKDYFDLVAGQVIYQQEQENQKLLKLWPLSGGAAKQVRCPSFRAGLPTVLSPDGRYLLYTSSRQGNNEVYLYDRQAEQDLQLTVNPAEDVVFGMFPDQKTILFDSQRDGDREIYLMHLDRLIAADRIITALSRGQ